jgi:hypothetical protein
VKPCIDCCAVQQEERDTTQARTGTSYNKLLFLMCSTPNPIAAQGQCPPEEAKENRFHRVPCHRTTSLITHGTLVCAPPQSQKTRNEAGDARSSGSLRRKVDLRPHRYCVVTRSKEAARPSQADESSIARPAAGPLGVTWSKSCTWQNKVGRERERERER